MIARALRHNGNAAARVQTDEYCSFGDAGCRAALLRAHRRAALLRAYAAAAVPRTHLPFYHAPHTRRTPPPLLPPYATPYCLLTQHRTCTAAAFAPGARACAACRAFARMPPPAVRAARSCRCLLPRLARVYFTMAVAMHACAHTCLPCAFTHRHTLLHACHNIPACLFNTPYMLYACH